MYAVQLKAGSDASGPYKGIASLGSHAVVMFYGYGHDKVLIVPGPPAGKAQAWWDTFATPFVSFRLPY